MLWFNFIIGLNQEPIKFDGLLFKFYVPCFKLIIIH